MKRNLTLLFLIAFFAIPFAADAQLKINEIDYDQPGFTGSDTVEFIELYNAGTSAINLSDYSLVLFNGNVNNPAIYNTIPLPSNNLNPGDFFVICGGLNNVPNCNFNFAANADNIQNGAPDAIALIDNITSSIVDVVSYEGTTVAPYASGNGVPLAQSDTANFDPIAGRYLGISRYPDGNDSGDDSTDFNRVCITPGTPNVNIASNCSTVGLFKPTAQQSISIYPNPSRGIIKIDTRDANLRHATVSVVDMLGNELRRNEIFSGNTVSEMNISDLPNGVYCIRVTGEDGKQRVQRLILRK